MALPTIPGSSLSLGQIQTEFGGSNPISMSEYYAGGSYVNAGTANATSVTIPSSPGTIRFSNFSGATKIITLYNGGTITQGYYSTSSTPSFIFETNYGFVNGVIGSRSPTTLTDGKTLEQWYDHYSYVASTLVDQFATISISGFSSDPGSGYLTSAKIGSTQLYSPYYSYYSGTVTYTFSGSVFGFGSSGNVTGYIYR